MNVPFSLPDANGIFTFYPHIYSELHDFATNNETVAMALEWITNTITCGVISATRGKSQGQALKLCRKRPHSESTHLEADDESALQSLSTSLKRQRRTVKASSDSSKKSSKSSSSSSAKPKAEPKAFPGTVPLRRMQPIPSIDEHQEAINNSKSLLLSQLARDLIYMVAILGFAPYIAVEQTREQAMLTGEPTRLEVLDMGAVTFKFSTNFARQHKWAFYRKRTNADTGPEDPTAPVGWIEIPNVRVCGTHFPTSDGKLTSVVKRLHSGVYQTLRKKQKAEEMADNELSRPTVVTTLVMEKDKSSQQGLASIDPSLAQIQAAGNVMEADADMSSAAAEVHARRAGTTFWPCGLDVNERPSKKSYDSSDQGTSSKPIDKNVKPGYFNQFEIEPGHNFVGNHQPKPPQNVDTMRIAFDNTVLSAFGIPPGLLSTADSSGKSRMQQGGANMISLRLYRDSMQRKSREVQSWIREGLIWMYTHDLVTQVEKRIAERAGALSSDEEDETTSDYISDGELTQLALDVHVSMPSIVDHAELLQYLQAGILTWPAFARTFGHKTGLPTNSFPTDGPLPPVLPEIPTDPKSMHSQLEDQLDF